MELTGKEWSEYFLDGETFSALPFMIEAVSEMAAELYGMKYSDKGRWWYGEWEGDRRKVITIDNNKGTERDILWGWNYNYIAHTTNRDTLKYARTEKAFHIDVWDTYGYHTDYIKEGFSNTIELWEKYALPIWTNNAEVARGYMKTVCRRNAPFIKEFFERTKTERDIIAHLDMLLSYPSPFMRTENYVKAFIIAKNGNLEEAERLMRYGYYENGYCNAKVLAKLRQVYEDGRNGS